MASDGTISPPDHRISPVQRQKVQLGNRQDITMEPLSPASNLPMVIRPVQEPVDLLFWASQHRELIESTLEKDGGVLFRGFPVQGLADFRSFIETVGGKPLEYTNRSTPRKEVGANIYTSTEYPAEQEIPMHNENSYSHFWPMKIFFFCEKNAEVGGMTPIADSYQVYERIAPEIRERFAAKKIMYVRNYGQGADLPWQEVFQTQDKAEVEDYCRKSGIMVEWMDDGRLRTRQVCQAVAQHPKTRRMVWFNQAHLFHVSSLNAQVREAMLEILDEEDLPRNAYYGDGSALEVSVLDEIRATYRQVQIAFPWREGDILLLDNMAVAHGRTPFKGDRKIRVGMTI